MVPPARPTDESLGRFRRLIDRLPLMIASFDRDRRLTFANEPYARRLGVSPGELVGRCIDDVLGAEVVRRMEPHIERALAGEDVEFEMPLPRADIGAQQVRALHVPERDEHGSVIGWHAAFQSSTSDRRIESDARSLAMLVENANDFIGWCDLDLRPGYVNRFGLTMLGTTLEEVRGLTIMDFFFPEDVPMIRDEFIPLVQRDGFAAVEVRFRHFRTGAPVWMHYSVVSMRGPDDEVIGFATISRDLTARRRVEELIRGAMLRAEESAERLRAALEASGTGTFRWDIRTNALDGDTNLDRLFGLPSGATPRSMSEFIELVHADDRARVRAACEQCATAGGNFDEEFRVVWPDGTEHWLSDHGRTYLGDDGRPSYMTGACIDITERRQKEDALVAADRQKDEFLGMLAHELRNPLAPIQYSITALERTAGPEATRPLQMMSRQVRRMTRIVDDLLDVSRVTQGKISLQRAPVDLVAIVSHLVEAMRPTTDARRQRVVATLPPHPVRVSGDPVRLAQVLENLLSNAAKYTEPHGIVEVALEARGSVARIVVRDNGIGIAADVLPRIFDLFVQADTSLDRAEGGLGIGLTLVDRLTRMHGGTVTAHSDGPGLGSEFVVQLPLVEAAATDLAEAVRVEQQTPSRRYLVVDDNEDAAEALGLLLEMSGHIVRIIHTGHLALAAAREFHPDVVLLDVGLPGMDGYEVVRQFRASPDLAQLMIIATTGYGRAEDRARCLAAGFDHHVVKPLDIDQIERLVGGSSTAS